MRPGARIPHRKGAIDDKSLRSFNPEAARRAILAYLKTDPNISKTAEMFAITRAVVYDILRKEREGNLRDRSRAPRHQPGKTPAAVEDRVVALKNKTHLGPERLSRYLKEYEGMVLLVGTIRHILSAALAAVSFRTTKDTARKMPTRGYLDLRVL